MTEKEYIKANLKKILKYYGLKENNNTNWDCLEGRHENHKRKIKVTETYCCCHCGIKGDSFNVIQFFEGYSKNDFLKALSKAKEILSISENEKFEHTSKPNKEKQTKQKKEYEELQKNLLLLNKNINFYLNKKHIDYRSKPTDFYFRKRGIDNLNVLDNVLTMNPKKVIPSFFYSEKIKNIGDYENIIPIYEKGIIKNCILRRKNNNGIKVLNLRNTPLKIYNADILRNELKDEIVYITEGIFDCLSFENENKKAISINSITMINRLFDIININKKKYKNVVFVIAFDFDSDKKKNYGLLAAQDLQKKLTDININSKILKIQNYNDINDFYVQDKETFLYKLNVLEKALNKIIYKI